MDIPGTEVEYFRVTSRYFDRRSLSSAAGEKEAPY